MIKKDYQKPSVKVIKIQHSQMLCTSPGVKNVIIVEGLDWNSVGFGIDEIDL